MKTLPLNASKEAIVDLLIEWTERLAEEKYEEAFKMFQAYNHSLEWTPELLESAVFTYGCPGFTREEAEKEFGTSDYKVTSLLEDAEKDDIIKEIDIEYETLTLEKAKMRCLEETDWENIMGMIHYDGVPLNGCRSDLTGIFYMKKLDENTMTLSFYDLHVM